MVILAEVHPFEKAISVVGAIALGIVFCAVFFTLLGMLRRDGGVNRIKIAGVLGEGKRCNVFLGSGKVYENVRIVGVTNSSQAKGGFPWELHGMMILEHDDGRHTLIQAKLIRSIDIPAS
ncbi:hypothetical protein Pla175_14230 [Pirellulimonas nuda]|uniref:Uncharacterized protein n=1 Tax=Pirellulimonas nuda TaxID=2528009 RepID=A0A518D9A2_9BACT|nr:hypothetical protein [Pirellulimonas nuda]QDU88053.1 hypothetical protein Pla175_14230 [Pirellulimonas nuda]